MGGCKNLVVRCEKDSDSKGPGSTLVSDRFSFC